MTALREFQLHERFGVEIADLDLNRVTERRFFPEIRAAFEAHSLLLFRGQSIDDGKHIELAKLFGPLEDRQADEHQQGETGFRVSRVSNVKDGVTVRASNDLHLQNLQANFLWHTDSTFLPIPALSNILICRVPSLDGGATELVSTRAAWADMPEKLKSRIRNRRVWHRYAHSRGKISANLADERLFTKWPDRAHGSVWSNPVNGAEALYIASHACRIDGIDDAEAQRLLDQLIEFCTQPQYVYHHQWREGDVLIWDERATLHRGRPWPFEQPRVLSSICSSVTASDGLAV